jgi:hypothetical protein
MSLINKDDFSMHGVVLQNRVFRPWFAMFHVKHSRVKGLPSQAHTACDVSRETIFSGAGAAMFHVKHLCVKARAGTRLTASSGACRDAT